MICSLIFAQCMKSFSSVHTHNNLMLKRLMGQRKNPPPTNYILHNVTSRLMSNTTSKYIFTEYWSSIIQYLNDLSRSLKVNSIGAIKLPLYGFLFMFNCNIVSNWAPFQHIRVWNLDDVGFDLSGSLKVKYQCANWTPYIWFPINV